MSFIFYVELQESPNLLLKRGSRSCSVVFDSLWPMDWHLPGSFVPEILQASILEQVAVPFSRGSSPLRDRTQVSHIAGGFFTSWATREAEEEWKHFISKPFCLTIFLTNNIIKDSFPRVPDGIWTWEGTCQSANFTKKNQHSSGKVNFKEHNLRLYRGIGT